MANEEEVGHFCQDYLSLKPKEASFFDLIRLLYSSELDQRRFVDCSLEWNEEESNKFRRRWIILISVVAQKVLLFLRKPMAVAGHLIELVLNLLSSNNSFLHILINVLTGKQVSDRSSATFTSLVGSLDSRVELDRSIKPNTRKYYASLSFMAAKLSYENEAFVKNIVQNHWKMDFLGFYNFWNVYQKRSSTQTILLHDTRTDPNMIVIAFRGTVPYDALDWCTDFDISWYEIQNVGKVHGGFMKALGLQENEGWPNEIHQQSEHQKLAAYYELRKQLKEMLKKDKEAKFILTGHSLGGALAILFVFVLVLHEETWLLERLEGVYTFGQPRVGDKKFGEFMKEKLKKYNVNYLRYVYCNDMVPRLPYDDKTLLFKHFGRCLYYNSFYEGEVLPEEPNKNYFNLLWVMPKCINAVWELIRGFILPYVRGQDYREGWCLRFLRVIGLVIPGLSAHLPQDYNNVTRLGFSPPFELDDPNHD